ncbi:MAG TPA: hypothetical protein VIF32_10065 [Gemmatimonadaceae bacterium]
MESAPRTSLRVDSVHERWEGYWSVADEGYYARCVRADGSEQWYRFAHEDSRENVADPRVIPLRPRLTRDVRRTPRRDEPRTPSDRQMLLVTAAKGRRPILVGTSRRRSRADAGGVR